MICGVCIIIRRAALEAGFLENYHVDVSTKRTMKNEDGEEEEELNFNIGDFKSKYEVTVSGACKAALDMRPEYRTAADISTICRTLRQMSSFRKYSREMQEMLAKLIRYEFCNKRRVVIRKGHLGYSLYFIFSGSVKIVLEKEEEKIHVCKPVAVLRKGACFGEIALLKECRRNATAVAAEDTELLVIDKEDFIENGLHLRMQEECNFRKDFFRNVDLLSSWSDENVQEMAFTSRLEEYNHERVIVQDSRTNEWLWFVVKGSCDVLRLVDLSRCSPYQRLILKQHNAEQFVHTRAGVSLQDLLPSKPSRTIKSAGREIISKARRMSAAERTRQITTQGDAPGVPSPNMLSQMELTNLAELVKSMSSKAVVEHEAGDEVEKEIERKSSYETIGSGVFVKVDNLHDGECFGIDSIFETPKLVSLVSKGCEVIRVPKAQFVALADNQTMSRLQELVKHYPQDSELCKTFLRQNKWNCFKHELLEAMIGDIQTGNGFANNLRNFKRIDYLSKGAEDYSSTRGPEKPLFYKRQLTPRDGCSNHRKLERREDSKENGLTKSMSPISSSHQSNWDPPDLNKRRSFRPFSSPVRPNNPHAHGHTRTQSAYRPVSRSSTSAETGYKVNKAPVFSQGSQCKLQIVKSIHSPGHTHRLRKIRFQ